MASLEALKNRDYTLILDKSGSMSKVDAGQRQSRWEVMQESTLALARKCEQFDPEGITVYMFSSKFKRYEDVTAAKVEEIFLENDPIGTTNLAAVLWDACQNYFQRKAAGNAKAGETILVITDGEPDDRRAVVETVVRSTQQMATDEELAITFVQVGNDAGAKQFLTALDDQLEGVGAKFDICDTVTMEDMAEMSLAEVLINAIAD
jgi:uncharacterized protein with von Willebrand factor type A (vWA) domain